MATGGPYEYQPRLNVTTFEEAVRDLRARVPNEIRLEWVNYLDPGALEQVAGALPGVAPVLPFGIDTDQLERFRREAGYSGRYPGYYPSLIAEKSLEHFLACQLLNINSGEVFVDLAAEFSPLYEIAGRLFGAQGYA